MLLIISGKEQKVRNYYKPMKAFHFMDKVTERVSNEYEDIDTLEDVWSKSEEEKEYDKMMREIKEELKVSE